MPQHMAAVATITCHALPRISALGHCDLSMIAKDQHPEMLRQKLLTHCEYQRRLPALQVSCCCQLSRFGTLKIHADADTADAAVSIAKGLTIAFVHQSSTAQVKAEVSCQPDLQKPTSQGQPPLK